MWSDRSDEEELPAEKPGLSFLLVVVIYMIIIIGFAVAMALTVR